MQSIIKNKKKKRKKPPEFGQRSKLQLVIEVSSNPVRLNFLKFIDLGEQRF